MNKYQEALDFLKSENVTAWSNYNLDLLNHNLDVIKELVDKETPKKPDYEGDGYDDNGQINYDTWICPNCRKRYEVDYDDYDYCPNCGQKLDWEE